MKNKSLIHSFVLLFCIAVFSFLLRITGLFWDGGFHLHPDERAILLFTLPISFPSSFIEFLSPSSNLNPHFFAYGSFPLYLLKGVSIPASFFNNSIGTYENMHILGRVISALFDTGTIVMLFFLTRKIFTNKIGLIASLLYGISVLPIQLSHFYAVDTILTFFITTLIYVLILFYEKPTILKSIIIGILFGTALATKISAIVILFSIGLTLTTDIILEILRKGRNLYPLIRRLIFFLLIISITTVAMFFILEPYAYLDFANFYKQNQTQYNMTHNAFIFPYTLQYVGKIPYLFELKNIFFWGLGPIMSLISLFGFLLLLFHIGKERKIDSRAKEIIIVTFFILYFGIVGSFAIGFMRYLLPIYPFLAIFGAYGLSFIKSRMPFAFWAVILVLLLIWPASFFSIYNNTHPRVVASLWIHSKIAEGSTIAVEHWDDSLPLYGQEKYNVETLALYEPDSKEKWEKINKQLQKSEYIILSSNRLYIPLQKLTDCKKLPSIYCYPQTAQYYKNLFSGKLGFKNVAEFTNYPTIPILGIKINDLHADESFTVYDHPKVIIFKK